jgi:hypothetical protein
VFGSTKKYPAVHLRQVEKDTAAALGEGGLAKWEHLPGRNGIEEVFKTDVKQR